MEINSMSYELGVMMFNAFNPEYSEVIGSLYDLENNFMSLYRAVKVDVNLKHLLEGYTSEGMNYGLEKDDLANMFIEDFSEVK